jgi:hypothetical protein
VYIYMILRMAVVRHVYWCAKKALRDLPKARPSLNRLLSQVLKSMSTRVQEIELADVPPSVSASNSWTKLLQPSLSDLFFLFITVWMFLASPKGWQRLLQDADTTLHIRIGQQILSSGSIPTTDWFSFSKPGGTWYAFEWLSEVVLALAYNLASFKGVALLAGMLIALYLTLMLKYAIWRGANGMIALIVALIAATASTIHFHARPHLFTLLLLTVSIWALEYNRRAGGRLIWTLVPLTALWANLHGGFVIFLVLLALRCAGCAGEAWLWPQPSHERLNEAKQLAKVGLACVLASLVNPYGIYLHLHIFDTLRSTWIMANVQEFMSPAFRSEQMYYFMILLFAGLFSVVSLIQTRRLVEPLWILFLAYASLTSVRHAPIFMLVAAPIVALEASLWWASAARGRPRDSLLVVLDDITQKFSTNLRGTSALIPAFIVVVALVPGIPWPQDFAADAVPMKLVEKHLDLLSSGRLFASDQIADYLIFRNVRQKVFIDSRHNYYGDKIGNDYIAIADGGSRWRSLLDQYRIDVVLAETNAPITSLVRTAADWILVDSDKQYALFARHQ